MRVSELEVGWGSKRRMGRRRVQIKRMLAKGVEGGGSKPEAPVEVAAAAGVPKEEEGEAGSQPSFPSWQVRREVSSDPSRASWANGGEGGFAYVGRAP
jgi:hypothetical protein